MLYHSIRKCKSDALRNMFTHKERKVRCANPFSLASQPSEAPGVRHHQMACPTAEMKKKMPAIIYVRMIMAAHWVLPCSSIWPCLTLKERERKSLLLPKQFLALVSPVRANLLEKWEHCLCVCKSSTITGRPQNVEGWDCLTDLPSSLSVHFGTR